MCLQVHVDMVATTLHIVNGAVCIRVAVTCRWEKRSCFFIPSSITAEDQPLQYEDDEKAACYDELGQRVVDLVRLEELI